MQADRALFGQVINASFASAELQHAEMAGESIVTIVSGFPYLPMYGERMCHQCILGLLDNAAQAALPLNSDEADCKRRRKRA